MRGVRYGLPGGPAPAPPALLCWALGISPLRLHQQRYHIGHMGGGGHAHEMNRELVRLPWPWQSTMRRFRRLYLGEAVQPLVRVRPRSFWTSRAVPLLLDTRPPVAAKQTPPQRGTSSVNCFFEPIVGKLNVATRPAADPLCQARRLPRWTPRRRQLRCRRCPAVSRVRKCQGRPPVAGAASPRRRPRDQRSARLELSLSTASTLHCRMAGSIEPLSICPRVPADNYIHRRRIKQLPPCPTSAPGHQHALWTCFHPTRPYSIPNCDPIANPK